MKLSKEQITVLNRLDRDPDASITDADRAICPGLHWCHDWDYLAVCDDSPEKESCLCDGLDKEPNAVEPVNAPVNTDSDQN